MKGIAHFGKENDHIRGSVYFSQECPHKPVHVLFQLSTTKKSASVHAVHIHEWGDLTEGCKSLGAHYNPFETTHGSIFVPEYPRHAGDLINNLIFDKKGNFYYEYWDDLLTLYGNDSIFGRSVVIHKHPDDLGLGGDSESLKTGNAGDRIACSIIGRMKGK